jgi:hypothetical protein
MGENFCCLIEAGIPKINNATLDAITASNTAPGGMPAIHIMVVVVSPSTLQAPPAFEAATMARDSRCALFGAELDAPWLRR